MTTDTDTADEKPWQRRQREERECTQRRDAAWNALLLALPSGLAEAWRWTLQASEGRHHYAEIARDDGLAISLWFSSFEGTVSARPVCPPIPGNGQPSSRLSEWGLLKYNPHTKAYDGDVSASFNVTTAPKTIIAGIDRRVIVPYAKLWPDLQLVMAERAATHAHRRTLLARLFDLLEPGDEPSKAKGLADFDRGGDSIQLSTYWSGQPLPLRMTFRRYATVDVTGHITNEAAMIRLAETIAELNRRQAAEPSNTSP